ncbi:RNA-directed DNA polymerase, eukaryota, reverse transcriptase zinc-binding domain protein [Tanacetum coccineum]
MSHAGVGERDGDGFGLGCTVNENASGFKVNLSKSRLLWIGILNNEVQEVSSSLGCKHDSLPFMYLGLSVGKKMRLCDGWNKKWRFLTEKDAIWRTVIKEFYGECGGFGSLASSRGPNGIWCDIIKAVEDIEKTDPSFKRSFHIKFSNGANVSFWKDPWCQNETRLMDLFPRLYALDSSQDCKIIDRWHLVDGSWCDKWDWRRPPRGRAIGDVMDLVSTIGNLSLSSDSTDRWSWSKDASGIYKVSTLSNTFQSISLADCNLGVHHKWNSWIPRKVNICVWRGSLNRLPTRINLSSRGISLATTLCPFCNNEDEDLDHCLINCFRVLPVWKKVWSWWHLPPPSTFPSFGIKDIAFGTFVSNGCMLSNKAIYGVFQCTFWAVWKWRNKLINAQQDRVDSTREDDIFPSIQRISKIWIFARASSRPANWNCWISRPFDLFTLCNLLLMFLVWCFVC